MSPDTSKGTATATEPSDIYDNLSQDEQDAHDRIAALGFKPEPAGRGWKATPTQGTDEERENGTVGPHPDLESLEGAIKEATAPKKPKTHKPTKLPAGSTLQDVAVWSEIKGLGYSAEKDEDGLWRAYELEGEREFGTADTIAELRDLIKNELIDHTEITIEVDPATDAPFLADMAPVVNKQLANAIIAQHKAKMARVEATAEETKYNKNMAVVGTLHKSLYVPDPSQPGTKVYRVGKIISRIIHTEEEKFVTEKASSGMGDE